ncbi:hypothetical protein [Vibrio vulnificus]|uniref:hypothetical protein n=1 Tax=Vibrio vulnificus TaxID=672 RepID=UPI003242A192
MEKIEQLGQQLSEAMRKADRSGAVGERHKISPLAYEVAKSTNPYLDLLRQNHEAFQNEFGQPAQTVSMPMEMLMSLVGDLPQMEQQLFWLSETKKFEGMEVKLSQDGTLRFY